MSADRKYVTVDGKLVPEGHPDAAFVASNTAGEVDADFVQRLKDAAGAAKADEKAEPKAANKAVAKAPNK